MGTTYPPPGALRTAARIGALALLFTATGCLDPSKVDDPNYDPTEITVRVTIAGNGGGRVTAPAPVGIDCGKDHTRSSGFGDCSMTFVDAGAGGAFSLGADPDSISTLVGWSGDCAGQTCTLRFPGGRDTTFNVTATFNLHPPVAVITQPADGATFFADDTIRARGHGTDGAGRHILGELWTSSIDGRLCDDPDGCTGFNRVLSTGTHVVTLRVRDSAGTTATASITIFVSDEEFNNPPVAEIITPPDGATFGAGALIRLAGHGTDPEEGRLPEERTVWTSSLDGALGTGWNLDPVLSFGTHVISLVVTDSGGKSDTASVTITVVPNDPPVVTITAPADGQTFDAGAQITFTGSANDPEEGALTGSALAWTSNVDGAIGTGTSFTRTLSAGSHTITLTAWDALGAPGTASVDITVTDPNPTASISGRVTGNGYAVGGATVRLTGPVSRTTTSDASGYYSFTQLPAGTYTIRVDTELNISFPSNPQTVTLGQGQALTVDFAGTY